MSLIRLGRSGFSVVDEEDFDRLSQWLWYKQTRKRDRSPQAAIYAYRFVANGERRQIRKLHREVLGVEDRRLVVDHINGDGLDNRKCNLRIVTSGQNNWNRHLATSHSSRFTGVTWEPSRSKWQAVISVANRAVHLGRFDDEVDAALAYDEAVRHYRGEFGRCNFPRTDVHGGALAATRARGQS